MSLTMTDRPASAPPAEFAARRTADELAAGDEAALVARAVSGDRQAVGQLVAAHQQRIARLVQRLLAWPDDVDDVVQDVFVDALRSLARFDGHSSLATWLVRIAINRCRSHQRRRWLRLGFLRRLNADAATGATARDHTATQETVEEVQKAIRQLKPRDREVIVLRYLEDVSPEDIARTLGLSRGAVRRAPVRAEPGWRFC